MPEEAATHGIDLPRTRASLARDLRALGVAPGDLLIVHSSMRAIGWVAGSTVAIVQALLDAIGATGTLVMPTQTMDNSDPAEWENPPVPEAWWPIIRAEMPAFDPAVTPTRSMGRVPELFRTWPGVRRSAHPQVSFAALGPLAAEITREHPLEEGFGERSPLGALYRRGAQVLLLGVAHESNTSLHLAEYRVPQIPRKPYGAAILAEGTRCWVSFSDLDHLDADDVFTVLGMDYELQHPPRVGRVGSAASRLMPMREIVDFAVPWIERRLASHG